MKKILDFLKKSNKYLKRFFALLVLAIASISLVAIFSGRVNADGSEDGEIHGMDEPRFPINESVSEINQSVSINGQLRENPVASPNANVPADSKANKLDAGAMRERCASIGKAINYISSAFSDLIRGINSGDVQAGPMVLATLKAATNLVVTLLNKIPGLGSITDAVFDAFISIVEAFDGSKQSDTQRLMSFIADQIDLVRDDIAKTRQDITELNDSVNEGFDNILNALKDSFENFEAKTRVNDFFSTSNGAFSYTQLKRYLFSNYTDGYALELEEQIAKENSNDAVVTELSNKLYSALMSTSRDRTSYLEMFYDNIVQTESHRSIFQYYADFLNSNSQYLNGKSPSLATIEFVNDVYVSFLTCVNYVRTLNARQRTSVLLKVDDMANTDLSTLRYVYGSGEYDYIAYDDFDKIEDRLQEMLDSVDYQVSKDIAYVLQLDKNYFYSSGDGVLRNSYKTKADTFGNVEKGYTLQFPEINQSVAKLFGYNTNNFKYYLTDSDGLSLNKGKENQSTYVVDTDKPFNLTVKYEVKDEYGNPIMTKNAQNQDVPLVYTIYSMPFKVGVKDNFIAGSGTQQDPYVIGSFDQFKLIGRLDRHNCYSLITDLDLGGETITQFFDDITPYAGTFNGNGHTISNLKLSDSKKQPSLFGYISSTGSVQKLTVKDAKVNKSNDDDSTKLIAGIIAGVNNGVIREVIVDSCTVQSARVSKENNNNVNKAIQIYVGGIAAENYGSITYSRVKNTFVRGYSSRSYGSNDDGSNANDVYAGGVVGYNGSGAQLSYISVDSDTRAEAESNSICDKNFSTRRPYSKVYAGGVVGLAGDNKSIDNLYSGAGSSSLAKVRNDAGLGGSTNKNLSAKTSRHIASDTISSNIRSSNFDFPTGNSYTTTLTFSGTKNKTYNIDKSLLIEPNTKAFYPKDITVNVLNNETKKTTTYTPVILAVRGFDSTNDSLTETVTRELEVDVAVADSNKVYTFKIEYKVLPDSPTRIDVKSPGKTIFEYTENEADKIVDQPANIALGTDHISLVRKTGKVVDIGSNATISVDTTKLGKQNAIIKSNGFTDQSFEVEVVCSNHAWINEKTIVEGHEAFVDSVNGETYFKLYGYKTKECSHCHYVAKELFTDIYETEIINRREATCAAPGYTGDRVPYYEENNVKIYLDYIIEKGTAIETIPHSYPHEDNMAGNTHPDYGHECGICGHVEPHLYSLVETANGELNGLVYVCETCGHTIIKENISRESISKLPRVVVNDSYSLTGKHQVIVYVDLHSSVGITSANFSIIYDSELTLVSHRLGNILNDSKISSFKAYDDHLNVVLAQTSTDVSTDGTILKLVFETPDGATANDRYKIDIVNKGSTDRFTDKNGNKLEFLSYEGYINIVDHLPGDVNGDESIDMLDVLIASKYIVLDESEKITYVNEMTELNPNFDISYADVNLDNVIDTDDVVRLLRFDAGGYESQVVSQKFVVNLNYNDGSGMVEPFTVDYKFGSGTYGDLPTAHRAGYRFDGWYTDIEGGERVTKNTLVKYNKDQYVQTLYAHFTINKIVFDANGGIGEKPEISMYTDQSNLNFSINSQSGDPYIVKESTIIFDVNTDNKALNKSDTYTHLFLGWSTSPDGNVITNINSIYDLNNIADSQIGTITLYAIWKDIEIDYYEPTDPELVGYTLSGWMLKKNGTSSDVVWESTQGKRTINSSETFFARWDIITYRLVYDFNGGKDDAGKALYYEDAQRTSKASRALATRENLGVTKPGYTFAGWTTDQAFAESWFYLVEKNYNAILNGFDYKYTDGETRTIGASDFVFKDGASLNQSGSASVPRDANGFIVAELVESLEDFKDDNGFVTLYALWTPIKIELTYKTDANAACLKGSSITLKENPITLPYYYGYDIVLPYDLCKKETGMSFKYYIKSISIQLSGTTPTAYLRSETNVILAQDLPTSNLNLNATIEFEDNYIYRNFHYIYNGYELFYSSTGTDYADVFAKDLSSIGLSNEYYIIKNYVNIKDSNGNYGYDVNHDNVISDDELYINVFKPGDTLDDNIYKSIPDLYIEVEIAGGKKLYEGKNAPFVIYADHYAKINGSRGDFSNIRNSKNVLIIPRYFVKDINNDNVTYYDIYGIVGTNVDSTNSNYYDDVNLNNNFKIIIVGNVSYDEYINGYLKYVEELYLTGRTSSLKFIVTGTETKLKRIVLSSDSSRNVEELFKFDTYPNYLIDIYFTGSLGDLNELEARYPQAPIFDKTHFRIRCYSEMDTDSNLYWHYDNGIIRVCAN